MSNGVTYDIEYYEESLEMSGDKLGMSLPLKNATMYDFYRACELVGIKLQFTDYALNAINNTKP